MYKSHLKLLILLYCFFTTIALAHTVDTAHYDDATQSLHVPSVTADGLLYFDIELVLSGSSPVTVDLLSAVDAVDPVNRGNFYDPVTNVLHLSDVIVSEDRLGAQFSQVDAGEVFRLQFVQTFARSSCNDHLDAFRPYSGLVSAYCGPDYLHLNTLTGLPQLNPGDSADRAAVGITAWILRVPIPFHYQWRIPVNPEFVTEPIEVTAKGPIAVAVNGVPIFHYERRPDVSTLPEAYDASSDTVLQGELDQCGGHAGQGDDYHYHYAPICLLGLHDLSQPIAFSLDGIPIYFGTGGTDYYGSGRYTAINNLPDDGVDECNAHDNLDGTYSYFTTAEPPYVLGCHRAEVDLSLQIEPSPLSGRAQGTANPYGGEFGEPSETLVTDFYVDSDGAYHLEHTSFIGSGTSAVIYRLVDSVNDCWEFEYREDRDLPGTTQIACRD